MQKRGNLEEQHNKTLKLELLTIQSFFIFSHDMCCPFQCSTSSKVYIKIIIPWGSNKRT